MWRLGGLAVADLRLLAVDRRQLGAESLALRIGQQQFDGPVLARREVADLAFTLDDEADSHRLNATGRQARPHLAPEQRAERVADKPIHDPARLLSVDQVVVDRARVLERVGDGVTRDLREGHAPALALGHRRRLRDVPGDGLALAVKVCGQVDGVRALRRLGDRVELLAPIVGDHVLGLEVVLDVDAQLVTARVLGQVAHVPVGSEDLVIRAEISLDRARLGRRLDHDQVLCHPRESSVRYCGSLPAGPRPVRPGPRPPALVRPFRGLLRARSRPPGRLRPWPTWAPR